MILRFTTRAGFTLVEFLTVFGIFALVAALSAASLRATGPTLALRAASRTLATDLRYASELASSTQTVHTVRFNLSDASYTIVQLTEPEIRIKESHLNPTIRISEITAPGNAFTFNALGAATASGRVTLTHQNGALSRVDVRPSGYVRIE